MCNKESASNHQCAEEFKAEASRLADLIEGMLRPAGLESRKSTVID